MRTAGAEVGEVCLDFEVLQSACWLDRIQPEGFITCDDGKERSLQYSTEQRTSAGSRISTTLNSTLIKCVDFTASAH